MSERDATAGGGLVVGGWPAHPHWGIYAALLVVSMGLLTLEISLTRLFSFTVWYHFAYLTISVALLGFGSSGALVSAFPELFRRRGESILLVTLVIAAVLTVVALRLLTQYPLEVNDILNNPVAFSWGLLGYYTAVALPFLLAGFSISLPFAAYPLQMGRLYFWDLLGAALGCLVTVLSIEWFGIPGLIVSVAGFLLAGAGFLALGSRRQLIGGSLLIVAALVFVGARPFGNSLSIRITSTKGMARNMEKLGGDGTFSAWTALNRLDALGWKQPSKIQFWQGTGLIKDYAGRRPNVGHLTYDGSNGSNIYLFDGSWDDFEMFEPHILRTPYLLREKPNVLVIGVGGGVDMFNAIKQGARHVTGVELQPKTVYLLKEHLRQYTGGFYDRPDVTLLAGEGRHFIRKTDQLFDLIQITAVDTFAAQATGAYVLAESYLYTVEAQEDYFRRMPADGVLSMVVGDLIYPNELPPLVTRLALNSFRALERAGVADPGAHLMVVATANQRGPAQSEIVLLKKIPFTEAEVRTVQSFTEQNGFNMLYAPPAHSSGALPLSAVLGGDESIRARVLDDAWFRMEPVYDSDPFFYNVAKWKNFSPKKTLLFLFPGSFVGQLVLVLMLAQSILFGAALILLPLLRGAREGLRAPGILSYLAYFLALGVGFMFIEISFVQSFVLFLGSPTYALSVTIFALLIFSSLGSLWSTRFVDRPAYALRRLAMVIAALVVLYTIGLARVFDLFLHLPIVPRILIAVLAQMPIGLTLGMFMPLGISCVAREHARLVPWAWGINGIGSVIGTTLAVILAMSWGFPVVAMLAALLYVTGVALLLRTLRSPQRAG